LVVANGGTGLTTLTSGYIPYGNGTGALNSSSAFNYTSSVLYTPNASLSANLTFTGSGGRILGDFTNATVINRTAFQTSTTNATTGIYALPNGTSTAASWQATNAADPTNASKILIATNGSTDVQLVSGINGSGTYLPLTFWNAGAEQMRLDTSGNLVIGGTDGSYGKLSVRNGYIYVNEDGINTKQIYIRTNFGGLPAVQVATADPLLFATNNTERMRIDSSGNVGIGTSSPGGFGSGASGPFLNLMSSGTGTSNTGEFYIGSAGTASGSSFGTLGFVTSGTATTDKRAALIYCTATSSSVSAPVAKLSFYTNNGSGLAERMIISSAGYVTTPANPSFCIGVPASSSYSTGNPILFNTAQWDITSSYNSSTGRFTAPVTGIYALGSVVLVSGSTSGADYDMKLILSNGLSYYAAPGRISYSSPGTSWGDGYIALGVYQHVKLNAGDYVYVAFSTFGAGAIYTGGPEWTRFYGTLLG
jgi:hypothetical protein